MAASPNDPAGSPVAAPKPDIAAPGTTPATATSKPVIVGHTAQLTDAAIGAEPRPVSPAAAPSVAVRPKPVPSAATVEEVQKAQAAEGDDKPVQTVAAKEAAEAQTLDEKATRLQEIIDSGEYNVTIKPRGQGGKSGSRTFILTVLGIVLIAAVVLFLLIDLKIIDLGVKLPFHIFKQ